GVFREKFGVSDYQKKNGRVWYGLGHCVPVWLQLRPRPGPESFQVVEPLITLVQLSLSRFRYFPGSNTQGSEE
ncbi:hypothetical protein, partial [Agrobacterium sp. MCAB5]|uniref:hypothetical protein n=1 Tax=Agrobacterium sp. MCAB5 TaxID=3233042 RepID=UPI003F8F3F66